MFTKFISKKIQETLNAKEKTLSRQTVGLGDPTSAGYMNPFYENPSAASYKNIKNIASRSLFFRFISNKENPIVIAGGERDENGKLRFGLRNDGLYQETNTIEDITELGYTINMDEGRIRPIAGIKSVDISYKGGFKALREASVSWVVFSLTDLERLTPHFLTIGKTVMIDWGWVNKDSKSLQQEYGQGLFFDENELKVDKSIFTNPQKRILDIGGNYGAMGGLVSNFNYELREDGGFDCTTKIISMGSPLFQKPVDKGISSKAILGSKREELIPTTVSSEPSTNTIGPNQPNVTGARDPGITVAESQMDSLMLAILNLRELIVQEMFEVNLLANNDIQELKDKIESADSTYDKASFIYDNKVEGSVVEHKSGEILWALFASTEF